MPGERLSMRKIREVLRLRLGQGLLQRAAAQSLRLSQGAVHSYMARSRRAGLGWPLPDGIDDIQLEALLFPPPSSTSGFVMVASLAGSSRNSLTSSCSVPWFPFSASACRATRQTDPLTT
jgi:hypothetical protein